MTVPPRTSSTAAIMSEFTEIIRFIGQIVKWVIERTIDLICLCVLVISSIPPWRLIENLHVTEFRNKFRSLACASLFLTLCDCVVVPLGVFSLASPLQWHAMLHACKEYHISDPWDFRNEMFLSFLCSILDIIALFGFLMQHIFPFRILLTYRSIREGRHDIAALRHNGNFSCDYRDTIVNLDWKILQLTFDAFIDSAFFLPSAPFILLCPSLWVCTYDGIRASFTPRPDSESGWNDAFWNARMIAVSRIVLSLYDSICVPLGLLALLSPLRHGPFLQAMREDGMVTCQLCLGHPETRNGDGADSRRTVVSKRNDLFFNVHLRRNCVYYGCTATVDIFLFPILLPLLITWYRYAPARESLFSSQNELTVDAVSSGSDGSASRRAVLWGFREYGIISRQFLFLVCDIIFLPGTLLVFLTQIRWRPLAMARKRDDLISVRSLHVYAMVVWSVLLLCVDAVTFPITIVVLLTHYRAQPVKTSWKSARIWYGFPMPNDASASSSCCGVDAIASLWAPEVFFFHCVVVVNFCQVLHDIIFVPILVIFTLLSIIRSVDAVAIICRLNSDDQRSPNRSNFQHASSDVVTAQPANPAIFQSTVPNDSGGSDSLALEFAPANQQSRGEAIDSTPYPHILPCSHWRGHLWVLAMNVILDFPFVILAFVVVLTLWRAKALFVALAKVTTTGQFDHDLCMASDECCDDDCCCCCCCDCCCGADTRNWRRRLAVLRQFALLLLDILFLVPMILVVCTLYRLPGMVLDFISRCSPISRAMPTLVAVAVRWEVPPENKDPVMIHATCRYNPRLADNGAGDEPPVVQSLLYRSPVKLFLAGSEFWTDVGRIVGDSVMRLGKSMIPLKLQEGLAVSDGVVRVQERDRAEEGAEQLYEVWIKLDYKVKRTAILKKLQNMNPETRIVMQVEASPHESGYNASPVVFTLCPSIGDLVKVFSQEGEHLPLQALDAEGHLRGSMFSAMDAEGGGGGIVDDFWIIVSLHFAEVLLDIAHLLLVVFILCVPWRAVELLTTMSESECHGAWREATACFDMYDDANSNLSEYRSQMLPLINSLSKSLRFDSVDYTSGWCGTFGWRFYSFEAVEKRLQHLESTTWEEYTRGTDRAIKRASGGNTDLQELGMAIASAKNVQLLRLHLWASKLVANSMSTQEQLEWGSCLNLHVEDESTVSSLLVEVVSEFESRTTGLENTMHIRIENALGNIYEKMLHEKRTLSFRKRWSGLLSKSTNELRGIIRHTFILAARDVSFILLCVFILLTVVRTLPLIIDLAVHNAWNIMHCKTRRILIKHLKGAGNDIKRTFAFSFYTVCVFMLVVGVPAFLADIPKNFRNLDEATACAKRHLKATATYLCDMLLLFTAWKTYKLTVTACIYAMLTPPACIAEALPKWLASVPLRLLIGIVVWGWGIFRSVWLDWHTDHIWADDQDAVRNEYVALWGTFIGVIAVCSLSLSVRSAYYNPIGSSATGFLSPSWSHILCLLLGPIECIQLSSVVLYFHWYGMDTFQAGAGGVFTFPVVFLFDRGFEGSYGFYVAMGLAAACVILWVIMVTLPLVYESSEDNQSIRDLQRTPAFDFAYVLLSRLIYVSIVATLLRPYSCVLDESVNGQQDELVVSTDAGILCGGGAWSTGSVSSILLLFLILTSTILHSDAPELLAAVDNASPLGSVSPSLTTVRFAPIYAVVIRLGQLVICYLCMAFVSVENRRTYLLCVITIAGLLALWCALYPGRGCSLPMVGPIRAGGFMVVMWCAIVCYMRSADVVSAESSEFTFTSYRGVLVVCCAILIMGALLGSFVHRRAIEMWKLQLLEAGLGDAVLSLTHVADILIQEEAIGGSTVGSKSRANLFHRQVQESLDASHLGRLLAQFEEKILAERLQYDFLLTREDWKRALIRSDIPQTFETVLRSADALKSMIKPRAALATMNKHVLALVFLYKLPEFIAWEVFSFLYDVSALRLALAPMLTLNEQGLPPIGASGGCKSYDDESFGMHLIRSARLNFTKIRSKGFATPS